MRFNGPLGVSSRTNTGARDGSIGGRDRSPSPPPPPLAPLPPLPAVGVGPAPAPTGRPFAFDSAAASAASAAAFSAAMAAKDSRWSRWSLKMVWDAWWDGVVGGQGVTCTWCM